MDGVINIYKPIGITSFDVVRKLRNICGTKKIGHTGTLDPLACGVLPVCVGKATKIVDFIMESSKVYVVELKLGITTDTYDREGTILEENNVNLDEQTVLKVINSFRGKIDQVPPMYSALKINGKKLYELARQGIEVERKPRAIEIFNIEITNISLPYIAFRVHCSKGTYIRSLCYDIGKSLGVGGTMWNLERVATGSFTKGNSIDLDKVTKENVASYLVDLEDALSSYPKLIASSPFSKLLINGVQVNNEYFLSSIELNRVYRVYSEDNLLIGLGNKTDKGFKILKMFI